MMTLGDKHNVRFFLLRSDCSYGTWIRNTKPLFLHLQWTLQTKKRNFYIETLIHPTKIDRNHHQDTKTYPVGRCPYPNLESPWLVKRR